MSKITERLDNLKLEMQKPEFLEGKGLSNEVNIRIFCYDPAEEMIVRHFVEQIVSDVTMECRPIERNLYKVFLSICDDKRITDRPHRWKKRREKTSCLRIFRNSPITRALWRRCSMHRMHREMCCCLPAWERSFPS